MIKLIDIEKKYTGKNVLKGVNLNVKSGEIVTLIGRIGSGKSTVINIICGIIKADKGQVYIQNKIIDVSNRAYIKNIGFILSGDYLIEDFSTIGYWETIGKLLNLRKEHIKERISMLLDFCDISDPKKQISELSSGNKMLVKIGTMLLNSPRLLIMDEPFNNLDIKEIAKVENILLSYQKTGVTIFMTSHYPEPIFKLSNRILLLEDGIIQETNAPQNYSNYDSFRNKLSEYFRIDK